MEQPTPTSHAASARYDRLEPLWHGESTLLHRATERDSAETVWLETIDARQAGEAKFRALLGSETSVALSFRHSGALRIRDIIHGNADAQIVHQAIKGRPLSSLLARSAESPDPVPWEVFGWVALQLVEVLKAAHETPWAERERFVMIHGQITPNQVFLGFDGAVRLLGLGLGRTRLLLEPGLSTMAHRPPELLDSRERREPTADVFGLGATLYHALTGGPPFDGDDVVEIQDALLSHDPDVLAMKRPEVTPIIDDLVQRMLAKHPRERPSLLEVEGLLRSELTRSRDFSQAGLAEAMYATFTEEVTEAPTTDVPVEVPTSDISSGIALSSFYPDYEIDSLAETLRRDGEDRRAKARRRSSSRGAQQPKRDPLALLDMDATGGFDVDAIVNAIVSSGRTLSDSRNKNPTPPTPLQPPSILSPSERQQEPIPETPRVRPEPVRATPEGVLEKDIRENVDMYRATLDQLESSGDFDVDAMVSAIVDSTKTADIAKVRELTSGDLVSGDLPPPQKDFEVGETIDRYRIVSEVGEGGMSIVYEVEHQHLLKRMAMKLMRPELSVMKSVETRFMREARSVSQLDDPNIVRVTDFGRAENGSLYLVMELLDGESLAQYLNRRGRLDITEALAIVDQILSGLGHAHDNEVIHRDLKPENIMLVTKRRRPQVKILDFGIAKLGGQTQQMTGDLSPITQAGTVFGTPRYMSPEQAAAEPLDVRSDLYSVGVILYAMLAGFPPFSGDKPVEILHKVMTEPPPPLRLAERDPQMGPAVEAIVMCALSKSVEDRFDDAEAFQAAIARFKS